MYELDNTMFKKISSAVYDYAGINLTEQKKNLVISRLSKRLAQLDLDSYEDYWDLLNDSSMGAREFEKMVNLLSTNYSLFFREKHHFQFLKEHILPDMENRHFNIWSAASSTGQEIYSILIVLHEFEAASGKKLNYNLYASDISTDVLKKAANGIYSDSEIEGINSNVVRKYFLQGENDQAGLVKIRKKFTHEVRFMRINLIDSEYKLPKMDVVFLRNAIIYFDHETKRSLIAKMFNQLVPGGYLFLGHSESLASINNDFKLIGKTVYRRMP